jgi:hypothetical protein
MSPQVVIDFVELPDKDAACAKPTTAAPRKAKVKNFIFVYKR